MSRETDIFPVAANAVLDSELKLYITLNSVSLLNAELTRNHPVKVLAYEICGLRMPPALLTALNAGGTIRQLAVN